MADQVEFNTFIEKRIERLERVVRGILGDNISELAGLDIQGSEFSTTPEGLTEIKWEPMPDEVRERQYTDPEIAALTERIDGIVLAHADDMRRHQERTERLEGAAHRHLRVGPNQLDFRDPVPLADLGKEDGGVTVHNHPFGQPCTDCGKADNTDQPEWAAPLEGLEIAIKELARRFTTHEEFANLGKNVVRGYSADRDKSSHLLTEAVALLRRTIKQAEAIRRGNAFDGSVTADTDAFLARYDEVNK